MATCKYDWPPAGERRLIGQRIIRIDGPAKSSGHAKYTYDIHRPGLLFGKILRCPYAHAKIKSLDVSAAKALLGVKAVRVIQDVGKEIQWQGDEIAAVAAETEEIAEDAIRKVQVEYEPLPPFVSDVDLSQATGHTKPAVTNKVGDPDKAFQDSDIVVLEGTYGVPVITHCCLEAHGNVVEWMDAQSLRAWSSTQGVSAI